MYWNTEDGQRFVEGERIALQTSSHLARLAWSRADANAQRIALQDDPNVERETDAMRERFRAAHRETVRFEVDLEEGDDEYGDLDEYGYAA